MFGYSLLLSCGGGGGSSGGTPRAPSCAVPPARVAPAPACSAVVPDDANDPLYAYQWHLHNTGQNSCGNIGEDIHVEPVWSRTPSRKGSGVRIAIVDDGLEISHEDLSDNVVPGASHNYVNGTTDPTGGDHGTSVAGVAAARDLNLKGVRGVAPRASLVGYNLIATQSTLSTNEGDAMTRDANLNSISSNSWGAPDGYGTLDASSATWRSSINSGLATGRGGHGLIYVWAAGNGAPVDNSNYDGQANYRGVIAVGATNAIGTKASYSERGANLWVSAPAGETCGNAIATTDRSGSNGYNPMQTGGSDFSDPNYTKCFNGTSAATPEVSGVIALMLEENSNLSWRDVRLILAETARKNDPTNAEWTSGALSPSGTAYHFSHNYGFGVVDANAAVAKAAGWTLISGTQVISQAFSATPNVAIPDNDCTGVSSTINVTGSGIANIEWVEVTFTADHPYSGDLDVSLTSPTGAVSRLAETHSCPSGCTTYSGWVFGSARHLGEAADGNWTLTVKDQESLDVGTFQSWSIKFYGR